jgi:TPR repeat protein
MVLALVALVTAVAIRVGAIRQSWEAAKWWRKAADQGDAQAQFDLG